MRTFILCLSFLVILVLGISCDKKNNNITQSEEFSGNLSGTWFADEVINGNSQSGNYPQSKIELFEIIQKDNSFKIIINDTDTSSGTITGTTIKWKGNRVESGAVISIDFTGQISSDGKTFTGTGTWTALSLGFSESGTVTITASKDQNRKVKLAGQWEGSYTSFDGNTTGSFYVSLLQSDSILSGTIKIPFLGTSEEEISGKVIDNCWTFGDINNRITFIGIMDKDSLHFRGNYSYYSNEGKWTAVKTSDSTKKMLVVLNSFPVIADYNSDLTYDGSNFWIVYSDKLLKYSKDGKLTDSIYTPGNYPAGLTFDGTNLVSVDGQWGSNKIYFLSPNGDNVFKAPGGSINGITFAGNDIWCLDQIAKKIYKSSKSGNILKEISLNNASDPSGLTYANNHLWYTDFDQIKGKIKIIELDLNGNMVSSFLTEGFFSGGISFDGTHILFVSRSEDKVFIYNLDGTLSSSHDIDLKRPSQISYDGSNIWLLASKNDYSWSSTSIYKLNSSFQTIDSIKTPGQNIGSITFANGYFWCFDQTSQKITRASRNSIDYFTNPITTADYLCFNNSRFWAIGDQNMIYNFATNGADVASFYSPADRPQGIAVDDNILWFIYMNSSYKTALCKSSLTGEKVDEITTSIYDATGLVYDGEFFWAIGRKVSFDPSLYLIKMKIQ